MDVSPSIRRLTMRVTREQPLSTSMPRTLSSSAQWRVGDEMANHIHVSVALLSYDPLATKKSRQLVQSVLPPTEFKQLEDHGAVVAIGSDSGDRYVISLGYTTVREPKNDIMYCLAAESGMDPYDTLLSQWLLITYNESSFLEMANKYVYIDGSYRRVQRGTIQPSWNDAGRWFGDAGCGRIEFGHNIQPLRL